MCASLSPSLSPLGARAVLDEASSSISEESDLNFQKILRENFADRTIVAIAHRLATVMDYDTCAVVDQGRLVEMGHPFVLLQHGNGFFRKLVESTGPSTARYLREVAATSYYAKES
jgi:ABC-type multidrug transport system fused ATPase/permease subunit